LAHVVAPQTSSARRRGGPDPAAFRPLDLAADRCKGCGLCIVTCPHGVLELDLGIVNALGHHPVTAVAIGACTSCALCARVCPDAVIEVYARPKAAPA
jgi:2-oxoglutarate ferredoxin oxidoreductase subunit delta